MQPLVTFAFHISYLAKRILSGSLGLASLLLILTPFKGHALPARSLAETNTTSPELQERPVEQLPSLQPHEPSSDLLQLPLPFHRVEDDTGDTNSTTIPLQGFKFIQGNDSADTSRITVFKDPQRELSKLALDEVKKILREEVLSQYPEWVNWFPENLKLTQLSDIRETAKTQHNVTPERVREIINRRNHNDRDFREEDPEFKFQVSINLTFGDLLRIRSVITQHYFKKGYINSFSFIPEQDFISENGIVQLKVVEGKLDSSITVNVDTQADPDDEDYRAYVKYRLEFYLKKVGVLGSNARENRVLNQNRLEDALRLLQEDPRIGSITAHLEQTESLNVSRLIVDVKKSAPPPLFNLQFNSNNNRSPSVGSFQLQPQLSLSPSRLFDSHSRFQDRLNMAYTFTEGSDSVDISYTFPLSNYNTDETLQFSYKTTYSQLIGEPFNQLDLLSYTQQFDMRYETLLSLSFAERLGLELVVSSQANDSTVKGFAIPLSEDADENGRTRVSIARGAINFTQRTEQHVLFFRSELSFGYNASVNNVFLIARLDGQWVRRWGNALVLVRGRAQFAPSNIPGLEQFGIGGQETVRGYRQNFLLEDSALLGSVELKMPILHNPDLFLVPFVDFGTGWSHSSENNLSPNTLWSTGLGLQIQLIDGFSAQLDWGIPLVSVITNGNSLQENGFYFSVETNFHF